MRGFLGRVLQERFKLQREGRPNRSKGCPMNAQKGQGVQGRTRRVPKNFRGFTFQILGEFWSTRPPEPTRGLLVPGHAARVPGPPRALELPLHPRAGPQKPKALSQVWV